MYEYAPKFKKVREKVVLGVSLVLAAACFGVSNIPGLSFVAIYQLLMVFCLMSAILVTLRCLMRNYVYRVEPRANGQEGDPPDFTVTEIYGNRVSVVCRSSVDDLRRVMRVTRKNKSAVSAMQKRKRVYHYTATLRPDNLWVLVAEDADEEIFLHICADDGLIRTLTQYAEQLLTD